MKNMAEEESTNRMEAVEYSKVGQYEAVVSLLETLRYCSDREHPLEMAELYCRCAYLTTNWLQKKTIQRTLALLLKESCDSAWVKAHGGRIVKVAEGKNKYAYFWEKSSEKKAKQRLLLDRMHRGYDRAVCRGILDKLGLSADLKNEERWRSVGERIKRLDTACLVKVVSPYAELILAREPLD